VEARDARDLVVDVVDVLRARDATLFVDPHHRRNVHDVVEIGDAMVDVDEARMRCAGVLHVEAGSIE
jgi:hypothetical protein